MAWTNLHEELDELFGELTTSATRMEAAVSARKNWLLQYWRYRETLRPERGRRRGLAARGGAPGKTRKLDFNQRAALKADLRAGMPLREVAKKYGIAPQGVGRYARQLLTVPMMDTK
jgi:hypothetical protein